MCYMQKVGIRELRQNLSVYLRRVKEGAVFSVSDRGKVVAILKPADRAEDALQQLVDEGAVFPATASFSEFGGPAGEVDDSHAVSKILQGMRQDRL